MLDIVWLWIVIGKVLEELKVKQQALRNLRSLKTRLDFVKGPGGKSIKSIEEALIWCYKNDQLYYGTLKSGARNSAAMLIKYETTLRFKSNTNPI